MTMELAGKVVVLIGGASGIGLAAATLAAREGAAVIVACRTAARVEALRAALPGARGIELDVTSEASVQRFFAQTGAFDHLVYTAGDPLALTPLSGMSLERAHAFFSVRYFGALLCVRYGQPLIRSGGSITLTSGMSGRRPKKGWAVVASVCGAMESFGKALAVEFAPLRVNVVCPGLVDSPLWDEMPDADREQMYARAGQSLLVGRVAEPDDIGQAYLFLMKNAFATGSVMVVDGGASRAAV
jgi:NAD(P)-dependent dehydrogenase (short-subunit alcohol dehydrogenase family)